MHWKVFSTVGGYHSRCQGPTVEDVQCCQIIPPVHWRVFVTVDDVYCRGIPLSPHFILRDTLSKEGDTISTIGWTLGTGGYHQDCGYHLHYTIALHFSTD